MSDAAEVYRAALVAAWNEIATTGETQAHAVWRARAGIDKEAEAAAWTACLPRGMDLAVFVPWARWLSEGVAAC